MIIYLKVKSHWDSMISYGYAWFYTQIVIFINVFNLNKCALFLYDLNLNNKGLMNILKITMKILLKQWQIERNTALSLR